MPLRQLGEESLPDATALPGVQSRRGVLTSSVIRRTILMGSDMVGFLIRALIRGDHIRIESSLQFSAAKWTFRRKNLVS